MFGILRSAPPLTLTQPTLTPPIHTLINVTPLIETAVTARPHKHGEDKHHKRMHK